MIEDIKPSKHQIQWFTAASMDWATGVPQNPSIRAQSVVNSRTHFCNQLIFHPSLLLPQNRNGINPILRALPWSLPAVKRQICMCTPPSSDPQSDEDESFWEKPEGKQIIAEIEDMKELISEAKKLKNEEEQASGGSTDLSQEIAKVPKFIFLWRRKKIAFFLNKIHHRVWVCVPVKGCCIEELSQKSHPL